MILAFIGFNEILPLLVFSIMVAGIFALLSAISNRNSRATERLARLSRPASLAEIEDPKNKKERFQNVLETAKALSKPLMPQTELETSPLQIKLQRQITMSNVHHGCAQRGLSVSIFVVRKVLPVFGLAVDAHRPLPAKSQQLAIRRKPADI